MVDSKSEKEGMGGRAATAAEADERGDGAAKDGGGEMKSEPAAAANDCTDDAAAFAMVGDASCERGMELAAALPAVGLLTGVETARKKLGADTGDDPTFQKGIRGVPLVAAEGDWPIGVAVRSACDTVSGEGMRESDEGATGGRAAAAAVEGSGECTDAEG